ncbi:MAG: hypothetical protein KDD37_05240 [Bdellovibrionales bacterium]|nr:hypothetical protein [Bdellovibrionales bacterium]
MIMAAKHIKNNKGLASMESIALLVVFAIFIGYGIGFFGVIHTGILNSIASRAYAFETLDNRADVTYFRSNRLPPNDVRDHYANYGYRAHGVRTEFADPNGEALWEVTERSISIGRPSAGRLGDSDHAELGNTIMGPERKTVNPVWLKTVYGICLNVTCGGAGS